MPAELAPGLLVSADLLLKGYHVFRAMSSHCPCDLMVLKDGVVLGVEVRTVTERLDGTIIPVVRDTDPCEVYACVDPQNTIHYRDAVLGLPSSAVIE